MSRGRSDLCIYFGFLPVEIDLLLDFLPVEIDLLLDFLPEKIDLPLDFLLDVLDLLLTFLYFFFLKTFDFFLILLPDEDLDLFPNFDS